MRISICLLLLLGVTTAYVAKQQRTSDEESTEEGEAPSVPEVEETQAKDLSDTGPIRGNDVKPWFKQDPSRRLRHRFHPSSDGKGPCKEMVKELLKDLSEDTKKEFFSVKTDDSLSRNQKKEKLKQWAEKVDKVDEMQKYLDKKEEWRKTKTEELKDVVEMLGEKVKAIQEIISDEDAPKSEQKEGVNGIMKESSEMLARVLHSLFPQFTRTKRHIHHNEHGRHHDRHGGAPHYNQYPNQYPHHGRHY